MKLMLPILLLVALPAWWSATNSHAAAERAAEAYEEKDYAAAAAAYAEAQKLAPSPRASFNTATARIAAGQWEEGSAQMAAALGDPSLRADALFNRGKSALAAKAFDHAARDFIDALRANPGHAAAKRNLEIALQQQDNAQKESSRGDKGEDDGNNDEQPAPAPGQQRQQPGEMDAEALLRSVQQHEQEELRRLKGRAAQGKVGW